MAVPWRVLVTARPLAVALSLNEVDNANVATKAPNFFPLGKYTRWEVLDGIGGRRFGERGRHRQRVWLGRTVRLCLVTKGLHATGGGTAWLGVEPGGHVRCERSERRM